MYISGKKLLTWDDATNHFQMELGALHHSSDPKTIKKRKKLESEFEHVKRKKSVLARLLAEKTAQLQSACARVEQI